MIRPSAFALMLLACASMLAVATPARATDWFVAPGALAGDGTRAQPFHDPWLAFEAACAGDAIHIAAGVYYGRHDRGAWTIDRPRLRVLGGYDASFGERAPWRHLSIFAFDSSYEGSSEHDLIQGRDDHSELILDGIVVDGGGRNRYTGESLRTLAGGLSMVGPLLSFQSPGVVVRNCILLNSLTGAAELRGDGSLFENNLVLNHFSAPMLVLRSAPRSEGPPIRVHQNTFAFAFDASDPPMGRGGDKGVAIRVQAAAQIEANAFIACGNTGIALLVEPAKVRIDQNVFALTMRAGISARQGSNEYLIGNDNFEELEDLGLASSSGNRAADLELRDLPTAWIDGVTQHLQLAYKTPPTAAIAALRSHYGLGAVPQPEGDDLGSAAPYLAPADAAALLLSGDLGAKQKPFAIEFEAAAPLRERRQYRTISAESLFTAQPQLVDQRVELRVALGNERNGFLVDGVSAATHVGFDVYLPENGGGEQAHCYCVRHGAAHRQWQDASKSTNARESEDWYLVRGTYRATQRRQKGTIEVEEIVVAVSEAAPQKPRPVGRTWFVRAGASGGDGSLEKPFRDPFQACDKAAPGDQIFVAGGDYFGKLRTASWKVAVPYLSLWGGFDNEFAQRDPWQRPTRLVMTPDAAPQQKRQHSGIFLETTEACAGMLLDGFVFDGSTVHAYVEDDIHKGLDRRASTAAAMVHLIGADIEVRNCCFLNAHGSAIDLACASGVFENNLVLNSSACGLRLNALGPGPWTIAHNTFLFAWDPTSRGRTSSADGSLVHLRGRAAMTIAHNLFAFAESCAVRSTLPLQKLRLEHNAFAANLLFHVSDQSRVWLYDQVWERRLHDARLAGAAANELRFPAELALDPRYLDLVLPYCFALDSRFEREDWVRVATALKASVRPPEVVAAEPAPATPPPPPKEPTLEELMAELERAQAERDKPPEPVRHEGPPYAPAYALERALELVPQDAATPIGARRSMQGQRSPAANR